MALLINFRVTEAEKATLAELATEAGLSVSAYCKRSALSPVEPAVQTTAVKLPAQPERKAPTAAPQSRPATLCPRCARMVRIGKAPVTDCPDCLALRT